MKNNENKKTNTGLIIVIIIVILLLLFAIWFFLLRDRKTDNKGGSGNTPTITSTPVPHNTVVEYDYRDGVLTQIVDNEGNPKQTDFVIDGIILIGNRHGYFDTDDTDTIINSFVKQGYKKEGINSSFYLNERIEMYLDTKYEGNASDVKIYIIPHKTVEEIEKMSNPDLEEYANENGAVMSYIKPDQDNHKYIGDPYVSEDFPEGKYDILFIYKEQLAYFININLVKEPAE